MAAAPTACKHGLPRDGGTCLRRIAWTSCKCAWSRKASGVSPLDPFPAVTLSGGASLCSRIAAAPALERRTTGWCVGSRFEHTGSRANLHGSSIFSFPSETVILDLVYFLFVGSDFTNSAGETRTQGEKGGAMGNVACCQCQESDTLLSAPGARGSPVTVPYR